MVILSDALLKSYSTCIWRGDESSRQVAGDSLHASCIDTIYTIYRGRRYKS